jgi:hypothetical protein
MDQAEYVAGVCNIGPGEINRRRNLGWVCLLIAILLLAVLIWVGANPWWRLFIFFPATMSASGFLQAYFHFCSGFARKGIFNFSEPGKFNQVADPASKAKDSKRGSQITLYAALIGITIAIIVVLI